MMIEQLLVAYYVGIGAVAVAGRWLPDNEPILLYGKTLACRPATDWPAWVPRWLRRPVPKQWFAHFYAIALIMHLLAWSVHARLWWPLYFYIGGQFNADGTEMRTMIVAGLFAVHCARRAWESVCVERHSARSCMHLGHYLLGLSFYPVTVLAVWSACGDQRDSYSSIVGQLGDVAILGVFGWAQWQQYRCHCILARLRHQSPSFSSSSTSSVKLVAGYGLPRDGWFRQMSCPHYAFEIVIYTCLWWLAGAWRHGPLSSCLIWVWVNLTVLGEQQQRWYVAAYPHGVDGQFVRRRGVLFPPLLCRYLESSGKEDLLCSGCVTSTVVQ